MGSTESLPRRHIILFVLYIIICLPGKNIITSAVTEVIIKFFVSSTKIVIVL